MDDKQINSLNIQQHKIEHEPYNLLANNMYQLKSSARLLHTAGAFISLLAEDFRRAGA